MLDVILKNAMVVDGSGAPGFPADVAIGGGRIRMVGDCAALAADQVIDVANRTVCPGFIDMHTHSDIALLTNPRQECKIMQGVTTEVLGQDGLSYAPVDGGVLAMLRKSLAALNGDSDAIDWNWTGVGDFLSRFDGKTSVNVCYLVPHGAVRLMVMGAENLPAGETDRERMKALVAEGMSEGAVGFSTGLTYAPCAFADIRELVTCCQAAALHGGYFAPHLRNYGPSFLEAIREALEVGRTSGAPVHFTHFHCSFPSNKHRVHDVLALLEQAQQGGLDISLDSYPYIAGSTFLGGLFPSWVHEGGPEMFLERIASPTLRERIRREMEEGCDGFQYEPMDWSRIVIGGTGTGKSEWTVGHSLEELSEQTRKTSFDIACDLLIQEELDVSCLAFIGYEENVRTIMQHSRHMAGSDGLLTGSRPHPRAYGTFARYLQHYTRDLGILSLERCIQKMTSLPASRLGLHDRGLIREGMAADLVVFDPGTIEDTATYENPSSHPRGIDYVFVNGRMTMERGKHTGSLAGRVLTGCGRND